MVSPGPPPPVPNRRDILRNRMRVLHLLIVPLPLLLFLPSTTERALAQTAPVPATGRAPIAGRVLTLDECVSIALEAQPTIQATLYDYAAARYRVTQALAPLLPQVSGLVTATKSESSTVSTFAPTGRLTQSQTFKGFSETFIAQVVLSQLLFDFGKNLAATEAARKLAEVAVEDVELQRQLISLAVKEAYTNILFAQRLIRVQQQAEYRQVKLRVSAAEATERQTFRNFFPDISGTGSYGGSQLGGNQPQLNENWTLGLTLSWSLFDGGNRLAKYQEAKASLEGAKQRVKSTELDIIQNVEQAEIAVEETQERIQAAQALVASAQENFRLAQGRFDAGVGTILELTDAQLALTQAQNTESQALADYRIALARLDRSVGRR